MPRLVPTWVSLLPYALLAFLSLLWGTSFLLVKIASRAFDPVSFALGRVGIGAATLVVVALLTRAKWPRGRVWIRLAIMALLGQIIPFVLLGAAARLTTSADLALMMGAMPIFTFVLTYLLGQGEPWTPRRGLGIALGFAGVAVCLGFPLGAASAAAPSPGWGRAIALLAGLCYGAGAAMSREASQEVGPAMAATASLALSTVVLAAIRIVFEGPPSPFALADAPLSSLEALIAIGVFNTAFAYFVYYRLVVLAGATFAALNNYLVPFLGLIAGAAVLGEPVEMSAWFGFVMVIVGVALTGAAPRAGGPVGLQQRIVDDVAT